MCDEYRMVAGLVCTQKCLTRSRIHYLEVQEMVSLGGSL